MEIFVAGFLKEFLCISYLSISARLLGDLFDELVAIIPIMHEETTDAHTIQIISLLSRVTNEMNCLSVVDQRLQTGRHWQWQCQSASRHLTNGFEFHSFQWGFVSGDNNYSSYLPTWKLIINFVCQNLRIFSYACQNHKVLLIKIEVYHVSPQLINRMSWLLIAIKWK